MTVPSVYKVVISEPHFFVVQSTEIKIQNHNTKSLLSVEL